MLILFKICMKYTKIKVIESQSMVRTFIFNAVNIVSGLSTVSSIIHELFDE